MRHSGGASRRCTSPTVTLYLEVELSRERRPGTEQNTSPGLDTEPIPRPSLLRDNADRDEPFSLDGMGTKDRGRAGGEEQKCEMDDEKLKNVIKNVQTINGALTRSLKP